MRMQIQLKDKLNVIYSQIAKTLNYCKVWQPIRISGSKHFARVIMFGKFCLDLGYFTFKKKGNRSIAAYSYCCFEGKMVSLLIILKACRRSVLL